jgi:hypothetical protein
MPRRFKKAIPRIVWDPLATAVVLLIPGAIGWATGQPWLFPSLGPTAFLQATVARQKISRLYNVLMGHLIGIGAACLCVWIFQAAHTPSVFASNVVHHRRLWASIVAVALMVLLQVPLTALHPPAAATLLLITLGGFPLEWPAMRALFVGLAITGVAGELVRRLRLMQLRQE